MSTSFPTVLPVVTMWAGENLTELIVTIEATIGTTLPDLRTATGIELKIVPNNGVGPITMLSLTAASATTAILTMSSSTFPEAASFTAQPIVTWSNGMVTKGSKFSIVIEA